MQQIKLAFIDFDDTICVHPKNRPIVGHEHWDKLALTGVDIYKESVIPVRMKQFIQDLVNDGIQLICLTHAPNTIIVDTKNDFLKKNYPDCFTKLVATSTTAEKVTVMKTYSEALNIPPEEILFVDDLIATLEIAREAGFNVIHPLQILLEDEMWTKHKCWLLNHFGGGAYETSSISTE